MNKSLKNKSSISKSIPKFSNVEGAPFKIGDQVIIQDNPSQDITFAKEYSKNVGVVEYFEYKCGCGQSYPGDPMIGIRLSKDKTEEFWKEELSLNQA